MLAARNNLRVYKPLIFKCAKFSTSTPIFRAPSKYKSKRTKLSPDERIKTPEELFHSASNVDIENLRSDVIKRSNLRYIVPNKKWINETFPNLSIPESFDFADTVSNRNFIKNQLIKKFGNINENFKWFDFQFNEISIGDVVDLSGNFEKSDLAIVIELPKSPDDPRYTLLNSYGEIQFVSRSKMGLRMPKIFPKEWFTNCVYNEEIFWDDEDADIVPVGKPKYKLEDVIDRNKIFESAIARSIIGENAANTYILPSLLSGVISEILTNIITESWKKLPDINIKLEILHNVLQSNESPIQLTLYQIFNSVELTDLQVLIKNFKSQKPEDINSAYKLLLDSISKPLSINNQYDSISLGKELIGSVNLNQNINSIDFYAFILGLRKNNQLYSFDSFANSSSYVMILPLNRIVKFNHLVQSFKSNESLYVDLAEYITYKLNDREIDPKKFRSIKDQHYDTFIDLLKLYCSGSIQNSILESFVIKIMRFIPNYKNLDITSSVIYDLLLNTKEIKNTEGPTKWWDNSMIPYSGVSIKSDYEQSYYNSINKKNINKFIDLNYDIESNRKEYDDLIYCIDSENPLEIDDGISIKKLENNDEFLISTFVADPSSYLKINSLISKIAFDRGLTLYLPDLSGIDSISLLPTEFGQNIQLGNINSLTRVLKVSFKYNIKSKQLIELENDGISFGYAKNFIKIDYKSVNKILSGSSETDNILNSKTKDTKFTNDQIREDLMNLNQISSNLNEFASLNGRISLFDKINIKKEIDNFEEKENNQITLNFKDIYNDDTINSQYNNNLKSETLVSEIMIVSNNLAGKFFKKNKIPAIYKIQQPLEMSEEIAKFANEIINKNDTNFKDLTLYQEYLTKSTISPLPNKHEFLNIENYATVTSPLRRFWDLINHWQLHSYLNNGKPLFSQNHINYLSLQLKYKDELNSKISNKINGFYTFKALKYLQSNNHNIKFKVVITKKPSESGLIDVIMLDYGVRCVLETSWYALNNNNHDTIHDIDDNGSETSKKSSKDLEIGDIIEDAIIKDIDLLDGSILLTSESV